MGQSQARTASESSSPSQQAENLASLTGAVQRHAFELKQTLYSLSYQDFLATIEELNIM